MWVVNIWPIKGNLIRNLDLQVKTLQNAAISSLAEESKISAEVLITSIESLDDIFKKQDEVYFEIIKVKNMFERISSVKLTTEKLTEFLIFYLSEFDELKDCQRCTFIPEFDVLSVLEILDGFSWSSMDWISESISYLQKPLEFERDLTIFLLAMFKDLSQPIIQTGDNLAMYHWWNNHTHLTEENFNDFFAVISTYGFNSSGIFDRSQVMEFLFYTRNGRKRLESLLDSMLENIYDCPNSSQIVISGKIISFDRVISRCINKVQTTISSIVLIATYKIYANSKIIGKQINANNNIDVILMSPEVIVSNNSEIDLSGSAGQQDVSGKPAGTQYSLFRKDGANQSVITFPNLTGGIGINGAVGTTGEVGSDGRNDYNTGTDDCAAWLGGIIQIRNYVNSCNTCTGGSRPTDPDCYCTAGSNGVLISVTGRSGSIGGRGNTGRGGSCGGSGGQSYFVDVNYFELPKTATNGTRGKDGVGGAGGQGGLGGRFGNTLFVVIHENGVFGRWCSESNRIAEPSSQRGPSGPIGYTGSSCTSSGPVKLVNKTAVTTHFASFKVSLLLLSSNEFLYSHVISFLNLLGNEQPI